MVYLSRTHRALWISKEAKKKEKKNSAEQIQVPRGYSLKHNGNFTIQYLESQPSACPGVCKGILFALSSRSQYLNIKRQG